MSQPKSGISGELSISDLAGMAKPACKLIDTIGKVGWKLYEPIHVRRMAQAEADAAAIRRRHDEATRVATAKPEILPDAFLRQRTNLEAIARAAIDHLPAETTDAAVDPDWTARFMREAQDSSDREIQQLWAKILAGEVAQPGRFSKRTLAQISLLTPQEARVFTQLCEYVVIDADPFMVLDLDELNRLTDGGVPFGVVNQLDAAGIIIISGTGYLHDIPKSDCEGSTRSVRYGSHSISLGLSLADLDGGRYRMNAGNVLLTPSGIELYSLVQRQYPQDVLDYIIGYWTDYGAAVTSE